MDHHVWIIQYDDAAQMNCLSNGMPAELEFTGNDLLVIDQLTCIYCLIVCWAAACCTLHDATGCNTQSLHAKNTPDTAFDAATPLWKHVTCAPVFVLLLLLLFEVSLQDLC